MINLECWIAPLWPICLTMILVTDNDENLLDQNFSWTVWFFFTQRVVLLFITWISNFHIVYGCLWHPTLLSTLVVMLDPSIDTASGASVKFLHWFAAKAGENNNKWTHQQHFNIFSLNLVTDVCYRKKIRHWNMHKNEWVIIWCCCWMH